MSKLANHRVLLVEDYAANILVATTYLEQFGYDYEVASTGRDAVAKAKDGGYLAILMDVELQDMDGLEATRLIRNHESEYQIESTPIIGMTAHALVGDRDRCLKAGMDDYIAKPFSPDELRNKLMSLSEAAAAA